MDSDPELMSFIQTMFEALDTLETSEGDVDFECPICHGRATAHMDDIGLYFACENEDCIHGMS